jgi:uncharacterized protein YjbI with pentapeptide repeats
MNSKFDGADLANVLMMYANLKDSFLTKSNLDNANFMCGDLERSDLRGSIINKTIFVEVNLTDANTSGLDKNKAFLKYSKLKGTSWE